MRVLFIAIAFAGILGALVVLAPLKDAVLAAAIIAGLGVALSMFDAGARYGYRAAIYYPGYREDAVSHENADPLSWKLKIDFFSLVRDAYWLALVDKGWHPRAWQMSLVGTTVRLGLAIALGWWWTTL